MRIWQQQCVRKRRASLVILYTFWSMHTPRAWLQPRRRPSPAAAPAPPSHSLRLPFLMLSSWFSLRLGNGRHGADCQSAAAARSPTSRKCWDHIWAPASSSRYHHNRILHLIRARKIASRTDYASGIHPLQLASVGQTRQLLRAVSVVDLP